MTIMNIHVQSEFKTTKLMISITTEGLALVTT